AAVSAGGRGGEGEGLLQSGGRHVKRIEALNEGVALKLDSTEGRYAGAGINLVLFEGAIDEQAAGGQDGFFSRQCGDEGAAGGAEAGGIIPATESELKPARRISLIITGIVDDRSCALKCNVVGERVWTPQSEPIDKILERAADDTFVLDGAELIN